MNNHKYKKSHPWITFQSDLARLPYIFWMNLGAVQSKCKQIANVLLPPNVSKTLNRLYLAKGVQATTAIEGNTLTEEQVAQIISGTAKIPKSKEYQQIEIENVVAACNKVTKQVLDEERFSITFEDLCDYNRMILNGLHLQEEIEPGIIPNQVVGVLGYRGAPREECEYLLRELCSWMDKIKPPSDDLSIGFAVIRAILFHLYFVWVHPFGDGNGRTARLVELKILLSAGIPAPAAHLLSNHYNQTRSEYYRQLDRTSKSGGDVSPFLLYAVQGFVDGLDEQLGVIANYQTHVSWKDFVYNKFHDKQTVAATRQRQIALDMWEYPGGIEKSKIRRMSTTVAEMYGQKTPVTVSRDMKELQAMGLVVVEDKKFKINFRNLAEMIPHQIGPIPTY